MNQALFDFADRNVRLSEAFKMLLPFWSILEGKQDRAPRANAMGEPRDDLILPALGSGWPAFFPAIVLNAFVYH